MDTFDKYLDKEKYNTENIYKSSKTDETNFDYYMHLIKKYCLNIGMNFRKNSIDIDDFIEWLKVYRKITKEYANFVRTLDINLNDSSLAEFGKGKYDSIIESDAFEISNYSETMGRPKLIFGDLNRGLLIYNDKIVYSLEDLGIESIISQNPNKPFDTTRLSLLSNELDKKVIFGIYGSFSDKDIEMKTDMIKEFLESTDYNELEYETDKDNYYMLVQTKNKEKRLIKRR